MKRTVIKLLLSTLGLALSASALAGPVDLTDWRAEGGTSDWRVQAGNNTVLQRRNGNPTFFFNPNQTSSQGRSLSGSITVQTRADDDFIGFALGYDSGEFGSASTDFWLIDWKQANQGAASVGLALSHVTSANVTSNFWGHTGGVNEVQRGATLGSTGWNDLQTYDFNIVFTSTLIEVTVDGTTELSYSGNFNDGAFAFYNYSQSTVLYSSIQEVDCTVTPNAPECQTTVGVSEAPSIALLAFGLGLLGLGRRRFTA